MTGAELKALRIAAGFPVKYLADKLGIKPRTLRRWEKGTLAIPEHIQHIIRIVTEGNRK